MVPSLSSCVCICARLLFLSAYFLCEPLFSLSLSLSSLRLPFTSLPFSHSTSHSFSQRDDSLYNHSIIHFALADLCVFIFSLFLKKFFHSSRIFCASLSLSHCGGWSKRFLSILCHMHRPFKCVDVIFSFFNCVSVESFPPPDLRVHVEVQERSLSLVCDVKFFLSSHHCSEWLMIWYSICFTLQCGVTHRRIINHTIFSIHFDLNAFLP